MRPGIDTLHPSSFLQVHSTIQSLELYSLLSPLYTELWRRRASAFLRRYAPTLHSAYYVVIWKRGLGNHLWMLQLFNNASVALENNCLPTMYIQSLPAGPGCPHSVMAQPHPVLCTMWPCNACDSTMYIHRTHTRSCTTQGLHGTCLPSKEWGFKQKTRTMRLSSLWRPPWHSLHEYRPAMYPAISGCSCRQFGTSNCQFSMGS